MTEQRMMVRAAKEIPVGTRERYEKIAAFVQQHAGTTWLRPTSVRHACKPLSVNVESRLSDYRKSFPRSRTLPSSRRLSSSRPTQRLSKPLLR